MEKSKGSKIILVLIILLVLILIVAGGAYAYIATDLFKSSDQLFKKYLINGFIEISKFNTEPYGEVLKKMETEPVEITATSTIKPIDTDDNYQEYEEQVSKMTLKTDNSNKKVEISYDIKRDEESYFNMDLLASNKKIGIYVDGAHDKYISVENRDFKKIAKTFGIDEKNLENIPDSIPEMTFSKEKQKELLEILSKYLNKGLEQTDSNSYMQEKYVIDDFDGQRVEGTKYSLTMPNSKYESILKDIIKELSEDEKLLNLFDKNFEESIKKQLDTLSSTDEEDPNMSLYTSNENAIKSDPNIKLSLYTSNGKTIKLDLCKDDVLTYEMLIINKENSSYIETKSYTPKTEFREVAYEEIFNLKNSFENNSGEITYETKKVYNKEDLKEFKKQTKDSYSSIFSEEYYDNYYKDQSSKYTIKTTLENNIVKAKTNISTDDQKNTIAYTIKYGDGVVVPSIEDKNSIVVNDYTMEDFTKLGEEIFENITKTAEENPNSLARSLVDAVNLFTNGFSVQTPSFTDDEFNYNEFNENTNNVTSNEFSIIQDKYTIDDAVSSAIKSLLSDYRDDAETNPDANPGDYLGEDKIKNEINLFGINELKIIDGSTIRCEYNDEVYFVKIYIDGDTWTLQSTETLYSEDGTLENAE